MDDPGELWTQLPDEILCHVLNCLPTPDLCTAAKVCRRWRRLASDRYLWQHVDLTSVNLSEQKLRPFFARELSGTLKSLRMKGCQASDRDANKSALSPSFFTMMSRFCPNLRRLYLTGVVLDTPFPAKIEFLSLNESSLVVKCFKWPKPTVNRVRLQELELVSTKLSICSLTLLPPSLKRLRIKDCKMGDACFKPWPQLVGGFLVQQPRAVLPVSELDLSGSLILKADARRALLASPHVRVLKLNDYFDSYESIRCLNGVLSGGGLPQLEVLEANVTAVQCAVLYPLELHFEQVCLRLGQQNSLRRLSVAGSPINASCAESIAEHLTKLESLDVSRCQSLSNPSFMMFAALRPTLRLLNVSSTSVAEETVAMLRSIMPDCKILY